MGLHCFRYELADISYHNHEWSFMNTALLYWLIMPPRCIYCDKGSSTAPSGKPAILCYKQDALESKILSVKIADSLLILEHKSKIKVCTFDQGTQFIFSFKGCGIPKQNLSELRDGMQYWKHYYPGSKGSCSN